MHLAPGQCCPAAARGEQQCIVHSAAGGGHCPSVSLTVGTQGLVV